MARTVTITLGDQTFEVPRLNLGQIEEMMTAVADGKMRAFDGLRIALKRATPPCDDIYAIEASPDEVGEAMNSICTLSGVVLGSPGKTAPS